VVRVSGVDSMLGLVGEPPKEIELSYTLVASLQRVISLFNPHHLGIVPYCFKCRTPVDWFSPFKDRAIFICPVCKCQWKQSENWDKEKEQHATK